MIGGEYLATDLPGVDEYLAGEVAGLDGGEELLTFLNDRPRLALLTVHHDLLGLLLHLLSEGGVLHQRAVVHPSRGQSQRHLLLHHPPRGEAGRQGLEDVEAATEDGEGVERIVQRGEIVPDQEDTVSKISHEDVVKKTLENRSISSGILLESPTDID